LKRSLFGGLQAHCIAVLPAEKELAYSPAALQSSQRLERQADLTGSRPSYRAFLSSGTFPEALHNNIDHIMDDGQRLPTPERYVGKAKRVAGKMTRLYTSSRPSLLIGAPQVCTCAVPQPRQRRQRLQ
jgi:hypothetical protein